MDAQEEPTGEPMNQGQDQEPEQEQEDEDSGDHARKAIRSIYGE